MKSYVSESFTFHDGNKNGKLMDGITMIPGALALRGDYKNLTLPVVIIAGEADKVVFKRRSEQLAASIRGSTLRIIKDAGHMVHHFAPRQVAPAIEDVIAASGGPDAPGDDEVDSRQKVRLEA